LNGGTLTLIGNEMSPVSETLGNLTLGANATSSVNQVSQRDLLTDPNNPGPFEPVGLTFNTFAKGNGSLLNIGGFGQDLGSANNKLTFYAPATVTSQILNGILPFAVLTKANDADFATYDAVKGIVAFQARSE